MKRRLSILIFTALIASFAAIDFNRFVIEPEQKRAKQRKEEKRKYKDQLSPYPTGTVSDTNSVEVLTTYDEDLKPVSILDYDIGTVYSCRTENFLQYALYDIESGLKIRPRHITYKNYEYLLFNGMNEGEYDLQIKNHFGESISKTFYFDKKSLKKELFQYIYDWKQGKIFPKAIHQGEELVLMTVEKRRKCGGDIYRIYRNEDNALIVDWRDKNNIQEGGKEFKRYKVKDEFLEAIKNTCEVTFTLNEHPINESLGNSLTILFNEQYKIYFNQKEERSDYYYNTSTFRMDVNELLQHYKIQPTEYIVM